MYAHFYQLSEDPFNLTPDPKFHYINESTREAMASLLHGIKGRKGFLTLIGEAGTGKTTLLKRVLDEIEGETQIVFVFNPGVSFDELLEFICMELGVASDGRRRLQLLERLNAHLLAQLTAGRNVVVMIDEAQTLDDDVLEELRLLSNLETSKEKILQILLSGQPELEEKLRKPNLRQLRQRIAVRAQLKPMRPDEIGPYVGTRLRSAGAGRIDFFTPSALRKIWRASKGIPRVVNVICDNAMMIAFAEGKRHISNRVIAEAIRDLHGSGEGFGLRLDALRGWLAAPAARYAAGVLVGLALAVPVALAVMSKRTPDADRAVVETSPQPAIGVKVPRPAGAALATPPVVAAEVPSAEADADRALELSPSASSVDGDLRISATIRDQMRRAEILARSTAARLYHTQEPEAGIARKASDQVPAPRPNPETNAMPSGPAIVPNALQPAVENPVPPETAPPREDEEAFVDDEKNTAQAFGEPTLHDRESLRFGQEGTKLDHSALASLQAPLGKGEADAFASSPDRTLDGEKGNDSAASVAPVSAVTAREKGKAPVAPAPVPAASVTVGEMKPVKAGGLAVDKSLEDQKLQAAPAETQKPSPGSPVREGAGATPDASSQIAKTRMGEGPAKRDEPADAAAETVSPVSSSVGKVPAKDAVPTPTAASPAAPSVAAVDPDPFKTSGPDASEPILGQLVRVLPGDTVWDIAVAYYGTAGPTTLKRILNGNPGIRDPRYLDVGSHIYLPWQSPEQMVVEGSDGTYSILLAVSPVESRLGPARRWVETSVTNAKFSISIANGAERTYQLRMVGLPSREAALRLATDLLAKPAPAARSGAGRKA